MKFLMKLAQIEPKLIFILDFLMLLNYTYIVSKKSRKPKTQGIPPMTYFRISLLALTIFLTMIIAGCTKKEPEQVKQNLPEPMRPIVGAAPANSVAGIQWTKPVRWEQQGERAMRVTTYTIPAAREDKESGECAVFYFGSGQGGNVDDNINRWITQFDAGGNHSRSSKEINGLKVTLVQISGAYLAPSGPMMESTGKKEHYKLLGAIVEAPEGSVFFKFVGPEKTVAGAAKEFDGLVNSITK